MAFPHRGYANTERFYSELQALGVEVHEGVCAGRWLWKNLRNIDYIHLHWPSHMYDCPGRWQTLYAFGVFAFLLALARWRGARVAWTVHNLYPHVPCVIPRLDIWARRVLVRVTSIFLVFGRAAVPEVIKEFPATQDRIVVIDHGHLIGYYPNSIERHEARRRLDLHDGDHVFLFFGACRPYKNLEGLIEAFSRLDGNATLVIAGSFSDPAYEARIRALIAGTQGHILLHAKRIPDEDVQIFLKACDAVVAPYLRILTSGTAILALSFGRPFVGPAFGFIREVIGDGCGCLYEPSTPRGLETAMRKALRMEFDEHQIIRHARNFDWAESSRVSLDALERAKCRGGVEWPR
jgi:glycosyltransferase involved in cell wall biosynthesis